MKPVTPFAFQTAARIRFGRGVASEACAAILAHGKQVAVVHGRSPGRAQWLLDGLRQEGAHVTGIACDGEPTLPMLMSAVDAVKDVNVVVGLGGGAAIDLAKAVAALIPAPGDPLDHLEVVGKGLPLAAAPLPFIAIPTTSGTGAEVTKNAVIGVPEHRRKVSLRDERMLATLALVDPALTDHTPRSVTLASGLDAITQVIEPYLSCKATPLSDALCRDAIPRGLAALCRLMDAEDENARDDMAYVSLCGGLALANAGLGAVHGLAGVIGGMTGAAHGAICGALLPHVLHANRNALSDSAFDTGRFDDVAEWMQSAGFDSFQALARWAHECGLPTLGALGVVADQVSDIADASRLSSSMRGNPIALEQDALEDILIRALTVSG